VRYLPQEQDALAASNESPLAVQGAPNVFLETIKRGEADSFDTDPSLESESSSTTTVVARLYEAFGGHAKATVRIGKQFFVKKAHVTNLLEDEEAELNIMSTEFGPSVKLDFRGFEVKTLKLVLGSRESERQGS